MSQQPTPTAAEDLGHGADESAIDFVTILVLDWAPGQSEIRLKFPPEAQPGQPNALAEQSRFRQRLIADLNDALQELRGP